MEVAKDMAGIEVCYREDCVGHCEESDIGHSDHRHDSAEGFGIVMIPLRGLESIIQILSLLWRF